MDLSGVLTGWEISSRIYDAVKQGAAPLNSDDYIDAYVGSLKGALDVMLSLAALSQEDLTRSTQALLDSTALVVRAYHSGNDVRIRSNYMIATAPTDDDVRACQFCDHSRRADSFAGFLHLKMWSDSEDQRLPNNLVLPLETTVEGGGHHCLVGAPKAYLTSQPQIIDDTQDYQIWAECESQKIRDAQRVYFQSHREVLGSFVSFPVTLPSLPEHLVPATLGRAVINVQSDRRYAFGRFSGNQRKLVLLMAPFMEVLGHCIGRLHATPR